MLRTAAHTRAELKSPREIELMREAGKLVARALKVARDMAKPGTRTIDIDNAVEDLYRQHNATPLFKGYPGSNPKRPFPASTCISLNEQVVHGIPGNRVLREGDLVKLDTACQLDGWCADRAISFGIGKLRPEWERLIRVAYEVLDLAIAQLPKCKRWSEVSLKMQRHAENAGFSVVTQYVGHGIGRTMHESPQVPNFLNHEVKKGDFRLEDGLVLAIEPMVNMGRADVKTLGDYWTVVTKDMMPSVHVEHTLALSGGKVVVVTADEE